MNAVSHAPDEILASFARALRASGVSVTADRTQGFLEAVAEVGIADQRAVYAVGRATLCASRLDLDRYDVVFAHWFGAGWGLTDSEHWTSSWYIGNRRCERTGGDWSADSATASSAGSAASDEFLRQRDIAMLRPSEAQQLAALFSGIRLRPPARRTSRHRSWHRGELDAARTSRNSIRRIGEPAEIAWRRRNRRPRRVVLLIDVSGSMRAYAEALLRLAHRLTHTGRAVGGSVETFAVGTRLTHLTGAMRCGEVELALSAAGEVVPDWSGGTRLGEAFRAFLNRWGQRGATRGAVVIVFSDGFEFGDASLLGEQMARLQRIAHRVIWVNPHRGKIGYEPIQAGMQAVLPYCDELLAGHSLATFEAMTAVIARA